jgi:hypothetical protein
MAFLIPVVLLVCGVCVNFAYMQLCRTELRVATDSAARAAGRAMSEFQNIDVAIDYAVSTGRLNNVGPHPLEIDPLESKDEILFGMSKRLDNGYGRYDFDQRDRTAVRSRTQRANSVRVIGKRTTDSLGGSINMLFAGFGPFDQFTPLVASQSTQVDRDLALVLDRSGSMLEYKDFINLENETNRLKREGRISGSQRNNALTSSIWARSYPYQERFYNAATRRNEYRDAYFAWFHNDSTYDEDLWEYAYDYETRKGGGSTPAYNTNARAPRHSRWHQVENAVSAFLDVLDNTDQEERVSMVTFNSDAELVDAINGDFTDIRNDVDGIAPKNGTNIAAGMQFGADSILDDTTYPNARFFAAKTIIVMSDGDQTVGDRSPRAQAERIVRANNVVIHTITFSTSISNAGREEMQEVARIGSGKYYHANTGEELEAIFREIANNLPTIITE